MAVNVKLGVDLSQFTSGIREGQSIMKGLNAEMKAAEAEFKATGNAEQLLTTKTKTLNSQIQIQKGIADQAAQALKAMTDAGIKPTDAAYQKLYATMMNATASMNNAQAELNGLSGSAQGTAASADKLSTSLQNIGKKISIDQVISGIDRITDGLERAAKKAAQLGEDIWNSIMDSAKWADDTMTQAAMFGIDVDTYQKMQKLVASGLDTTVESMLKSQQKFNKNVGEGSKEFIATMKELGLVVTEYGGKTAEGFDRMITEDSLDLFFRAGQAIMNLGDEFEKESAAQKLFGKSWRELVPLFTDYKTVEEYTAALEQQRTVDDELVQAGAELNDKIGELKSNFETLKNDVLLSMAPALTDAANALNGLLTSVLDYLDTPEGKQALEDMGKAVSGLFDDLGKISPDKVVEGFCKVFGDIVNGVQWIANNWGSVVSAMEGILIGWGALKLTGGALEIAKLINGISSLTGGGAAEAGAAAGASWGSAFANAVAAAAPWLIGMYTLLNPAGSAKDNIDTLYQNGHLTEAGLEYWNNNLDVWEARQNAIAQKYGDFASLMGNEKALEIMLDPTIDNEAVFKRLENELGLQPHPIEVNAELVIPGDTAARLSEAVGTVEVAGTIYLTGVNGNIEGVSSEWLGTGEPTGTKRTRPSALPHYANGIHSVPYDGMLARLHKGERVMPAREVQSRSFNSNLYVESMIMNNGTDAAGLAAAMAAAQQRTMIGYGS